MKRLKKFVALLTVAAVCFTVPGLGKLTVKAAEPVTYVVSYSSEKGDWMYKQASSWSDEASERELYYLQQSIKDGDYVVVDNNNGSGNSKPLKLSVRLGNLTVRSSAGETAVVYANGYDNVFVLVNTTAAINGDVSHAYVYGNARANFNNNVDTLEMLGTEDESGNNLHAYIGCLGTVNHLIAKDNRDQLTYYEAYNFAQGKLTVEDGSLKTAGQYYSKTAAASAAAPAPVAEQPAQTTAPTQSVQNTASSSAYDDVPKTGETSMAVWFLGAAAVCLIGGYAVRRKHVQ